MTFKCPYCQSVLAELPRDGHCPSCGRVMRVPPATSPEDRAARRRRRERMQIEAERHLAAIRHAPSGRALYSPKVMFAVLLVFAIVGSVLVRRAKPLPPAKRELPHQIALRQLDILATALGRYRFHVGEFPPEAAGLHALLNNPGTHKWNGPYVNRLRLDPWLNPYQYRLDTNGVARLFSSGPDRLPATPDDLRPDPAAFDPGTAWTNDWVKAIYRQPGAIIMRKEWMDADRTRAP